MSQFHALRVSAKRAETARAVAVRFELPPDLAATFVAQPGQHVVVRAVIAGEELRRTYSLCSEPGAKDLHICVRSDAGGRMTRHLVQQVRVGQKVDVFPPTGRFVLPEGASGTHYLAVAAGIGITPIFSILSAILVSQPAARVTLLYANRSTDSVLLAEGLQGLKNRFLSRLSVHYFLSRETQELELYNGRIDARKLRDVASIGFDAASLDAAYLCAPDAMMTQVSETLQELAMPAQRIHIERFVSAGAVADAVGRAAAQVPAAATATTRVSVRMDGRVKSFEMPRDGSVSVLDAAGAAGLELPYSCKGGVCSTCRTHLSKGTVQMAQNYALEDSEVEAGFVLACQSIPTSAELELDYDTR